MALNDLMKQEMQRPYFVTAFLFEINLPIKTVRILDGSGEVYWKNAVWRGSDDIFGSIATVDALQEQIGTEAPVMRMKMFPQDNFSLSYITDPAQQGTEINIWWAVIDRSSGLVVGEPYLVFGGELDAAEADSDKTETSMTLDIASVWERLFITGEGRRLNNANHQRVWKERASQERGFEYVVAIQRNEPWGYGGARPALVADTIGGAPASSGGGSGGGAGIGGGIGGGNNPWRGNTFNTIIGAL